MDNKLRVLIVDDDQLMAITLADILALAGYEPVEAHSGAEALEKVKKSSFDLVLTDIRMPGMDGVQLFQELYKIQPGLPVVFMTAYAANDLIRQGLASGAVGVLNKPLDIQHLLGFLTSLGEERLITVVDDDPDFCDTLAEILQRRGFRVAKVTDPHTEVEKMIEQAQIVLLDVKLNDFTGYEVLKQIRTRHPDLPVLLLTGYRQEMAAVIQQALEFEAYAILYKPLVIPELLKKLSDIQSARLKGFFKAQ